MLISRPSSPKQTLETRSSMHVDDVAIFWDYENCHPSSNVSGYEVVQKVRRVAHDFGTIKLFKAYLELSETTVSSKSLGLRSELQSSGVSLTDCPHNGRKDVADKMILVDMLAYAIDNPPPATIILISGDRDFAYAVSILRLRRYRVVIMSLGGIHASLKNQASVFLDWNVDVLSPSTGPGPGQPSTPVKRNGRRDSYISSPETIESKLVPISNIKAQDVNIMDHLKNHNYTLATEADWMTSLHDSREPPRLESNTETSQSPTSTLRPLSRTESARATLSSLAPSPTITVINNSTASTTAHIASHIGITASQSTESEAISILEPTANPVQRVSLAPRNPVPTQTQALNQLTVLKPQPGAPITPTALLATSNGPSNLIQSEPKSAPAGFRLLIERLEFYRSKGILRPARSSIAIELATQDNALYRRMGTERFGQYVALAEKAGIIELGGREGGAWIALCPGYGARTIP